MIATAAAIVSLGLAAIPAFLFLRNLSGYRPADGATGPLGAAPPPVSVLVPARDEERSIEATVRSVLANEGVDLEVIVLDDQSADGTAAIVTAIAAEDPRVRLERAPTLPEGWCGKQHACATLARLASRETLIFLDADVRLEPRAIRRAIDALDGSGVDLLSGFPRQETGTPLEGLLIPLIHFVLLGFLPIRRMRRSARPAFGAGCGQLFVARRTAYEASGGHGAIRESLHDGVRLPRAFRAAGFRTDLFDATDLATCRMYRSASEVWCGLAKNATEGLASARTIVPATLVLFGGQVLPFLLAAAGAGPISWAAIGFAWAPRWVAAVRFRQPFWSALLHPVGIVLLLAIQWHARIAAWTGRASVWKGRSYAGG